VHRSSYRSWRDRPSEPKPEEVRLQAMIKVAHKVSNGSAGARTISKIVTQGGGHTTQPVPRSEANENTWLGEQSATKSSVQESRVAAR